MRSTAWCHDAPATDAAVDLRTSAGKSVRVVVLSAGMAEDAWKVSLAGREHLLITPADVFTDRETIHLRSRDVSAFTFLAYPAVDRPLTASATLHEAGPDGLFVR